MQCVHQCLAGPGLRAKRLCMQWNTPSTCPAAKSATRRLHICCRPSCLDGLQMAVSSAWANRGAASPWLRLIAREASWGFASQTIDEPYLRAELEKAYRDRTTPLTSPMSWTRLQPPPWKLLDLTTIPLGSQLALRGAPLRAVSEAFP